MKRPVRWRAWCEDDGQMGSRLHVEGSMVPSPGTAEEYLEYLLAQGCTITCEADEALLIVGQIED
jgi:hypothetical protein